jgi:recombination protein RecR
VQIIPKPVEDAIEAFAKLPGVGPRTAERLTFYLLRDERNLDSELGQALQNLKSSLATCAVCFNLTDSHTCVICSHPGRQHDIVTVVEEPLDVVALEKTGQYQGLYHVLGGVLSPIDGIGPGHLQIESLLRRINDGGIAEIVLATNPTTEGEATALYIRKQLGDTPVKITRLARGLPVGGDLEYADQVTLGRALQERQAF